MPWETESTDMEVRRIEPPGVFDSPKRLQYTQAVRAGAHFYNSVEDADRLLASL